MYSVGSRIRGLACCSVSAKNKDFQLSVKVHKSISSQFRSLQNTLGPPIQSNDQQSTQSLRQADVRALLWVVVPHIINFVHVSSPQHSTAVHAYGLCRKTPSMRVVQLLLMLCHFHCQTQFLVLNPDPFQPPRGKMTTLQHFCTSIPGGTIWMAIISPVPHLYRPT